MARSGFYIHAASNDGGQFSPRSSEKCELLYIPRAALNSLRNCSECVGVYGRPICALLVEYTPSLHTLLRSYFNGLSSRYSPPPSYSCFLDSNVFSDSSSYYSTHTRLSAAPTPFCLSDLLLSTSASIVCAVKFHATA
jgi:hypothetical protein